MQLSTRSVAIFSNVESVLITDDRKDLVIALDLFITFGL